MEGDMTVAVDLVVLWKIQLAGINPFMPGHHWVSGF